MYYILSHQIIMKYHITSVVLILAVLTVPSFGWDGNAKTTRYWDCCKPSCAWPDNVPTGGAVNSCLKDGYNLAPPNARNICGGGGGPGGPNFVCTNQQPFSIGDILYAFSASNVECCTCYELQFTDTALAGKTMITQVINKGGDLGQNHFDIQIPGGGLGIFDGCTPQYGSWSGGERYGGVSSAAQCNNLPEQVRGGCFWRFNDFRNADNPNVNFRRINCPSALVDRSNCRA
ncbi:endoglucanase [Acrasis kona]|uniref:Cellulase n=1 Tax=Acrasis kona TaxID=1008807 RepID=A0AAW2Z8T5_9EUKA